MKSLLLLFIFPLFEIGVFDDTKKVELVSVMMGDSVTLHTNVTEIQSTDMIEWRFKGIRIGTIKSDSSKYDEAFREGMQFDPKTGDLNIINIRTTDYGQYVLKIKTTKGSLSITFNVSVVSVGQMHSVLVGEFVTLQTGLTDTQNYDVIQWKFGPQHSTIAKVNIKDRKVSYEGPVKTFKDRLQLDYQTGSLTITSMRTEDSGLYEVDIKGSSYTIHKTYNVTISGKVESLLVIEGKSVMLHPDTEIQYDDFILWMFGDIVIVSRSIYKATQQVIYNDLDGRFRDRLMLNHQNGSLTIRNITTQHAGHYKLQITTSRHTVNRKFLVNVKAFTDPSSGDKTGIGVGFLIGAAFVTVPVLLLLCYCWSSVLKRVSYEDKTLPVMKGDPVILETDAKVHANVVILWVREGTPIAEINGGTRKFSIYDDVLNRKLKGRLKLDNQTGSLTIMNITAEHAGSYTLKMIRGQSVSIKLFYVTLSDTVEPVSVMKGDPFTLPSGLTEIQNDGLIQCLFGDKANPIAQIRGCDKESPTYYNDDRFTGRLDMNPQTGSLTITDTKTTDSGVYELHIFTPENKIAKSFIVTVTDPSTDMPFLV